MLLQFTYSKYGGLTHMAFIEGTNYKSSEMVGGLSARSSAVSGNATERKITSSNGVEKDGISLNGIKSKKIELRQLPADTMLVRDAIKSGEHAEMFTKLFGAKVSEDKKVSLFPQSDVIISTISQDKGTAIMSIPNGEKTDVKSLHNWAMRDMENDHEPVLELYSPKRHDGSIEIVTITEAAVTQRKIATASTAEDAIVMAISDTLPQSDRLEEQSQPKYKGALLRDLPITVFANGRELHVIDEGIKSMHERDDDHRRGIKKSNQEELTVEEAEKHQLEINTEEINLMYEASHGDKKAIAEIGKRVNGKK
jgi:hypothetical protein